MRLKGPRPPPVAETGAQENKAQQPSAPYEGAGGDPGQALRVVLVGQLALGPPLDPTPQPQMPAAVTHPRIGRLRGDEHREREGEKDEVEVR